MKILFLYLFPLWGNGSGAYLRELSLELIKRGHEVGIIAPDKRKLEGVTHFVADPPQMGVFVGHPELPNAKKWGDMSGGGLTDIYMSYLSAAVDAVETFRPDVLHVFHTAFLPEIGRFIKAVYGVKYIITTHGSDLSYLVKDRRFIPLISDANKHARFITAVSDFTKRWYLDIFGHHLVRKMSVIVGGVNLDHYKKDQNLIDEINTKYDIQGKKVVLFTGRLTQPKGVMYLIKAAKKINAVIMIIGDGPERENIEREIARQGISNVILAGYFQTSNPLFHEFYERADVYVSPSVWDEPLGLTILEAMAAKTPVVATRKGGVLSIINDRVNGILIRPRNSLQIAQMVNVLLEDDSLREKLGKQAYKTVVEKFSWTKIAQRFEKLYEIAKTKDMYEAGPLDRIVKKIFFGK